MEKDYMAQRLKSCTGTGTTRILWNPQESRGMEGNLIVFWSFIWKETNVA